MSTPEELSKAAGAIATALQALPPEDREKVIDVARMLCPASNVPAKRRYVRKPKDTGATAPLLEER